MIDRSSSTLLSSIIAFIVPVLMAVYWPMVGSGLNWAPMAVKAAILLCSSILVLFWWRAPATENEKRWTILFGCYLGFLIIPSLLATNVPRALTNWSRIAVIVVVCLGLARAFRNGGTRRAFGVGALCSSLLLTTYIAFLYVRYAGPVMPSYESARILKETVLNAAGVGFNPMAFSSTFLCVLALCVLRRSVVLYVSLAFVIAVGSCLTGSRTPLALLAGSLGIVLLVRLIKQRGPMSRYSLLLLGGVAAVGLWHVITTPPDIRKVSAITEGRIDIWSVAWEKFREKPLTGFGAESWKDDLVSRMPGYYELAGSLVKMRTGGYHNAYLTLLAEEGLPVFSVAVLILASAFRICLCGLGTTRQIRNQWFFLFGLVFLSLRGLIEVPGLFGYGSDPAEFSTYSFLSLVIASFTVKSRKQKQIETFRSRSNLGVFPARVRPMNVALSLSPN
ncbi:MAG: O-antigen ligase family protein [Bryobacteraceae bacterium]